MQMTESEIVRSYKNAQTPRKQIKILAELNACDRKEIRDILLKHGCKLPATGNRYKSTKASAEKCQPSQPVDVWEDDEVPKIVFELARQELLKVEEDIASAEIDRDLLQANIDKLEQVREQLVKFIEKDRGDSADE